MKLRTLTGTRYEARCADGCGAVIPASPDVKVVVDFDSRPRQTWILAHSPDAGTWKGNGSTGLAPSAPAVNGGSGRGTGFQPASALPTTSPVPPAPPAPPKAPASPPPLALLGSTGSAESAPNPAAGVPWATASLTFNAGSFESARAGLADYAQPGESCEQLRARVTRLVLEDLERSVRAMRELHERLSGAFGGVGRVLPKGPGPSPPASFPSGGPFGGDTPTRTSSPGLRAGAPKGASATLCSPPSVAASPTTQAMEVPPGPRPSAAGAGEGASSNTSRADPAVADLVARVQYEMTDQGVKRSMAKRSATQKLLELRGLRSLRECGPADERALRALLDAFGSIDAWDLHDGHGQAPRLDERLVLPA